MRRFNLVCVLSALALPSCGGIAVIDDNSSCTGDCLQSIAEVCAASCDWLNSCGGTSDICINICLGQLSDCRADEVAAVEDCFSAHGPDSQTMCDNEGWLLCLENVDCVETS